MAHRAAQGLGAVQGLTVLDPCYVSLGLCLLAGLVLPARTLWLPKAKWRGCAHWPGQTTSWPGLHTGGPPTSSVPGCRPTPTWLRPPRCWSRVVFAYLSLSDFSGVREPIWRPCNLLAGGRALMWLLSGERRRKSPTACSPAGQRWPVVVGTGSAWTLSAWFYC